MTVADEEATKGLHGMVPFAAALGIEVIRASREEVRARVAWSEAGTTVGAGAEGGVRRMVPGGAVSESEGAFAVWTDEPWRSHSDRSGEEGRRRVSDRAKRAINTVIR